jgi:hypothetical protein
MAERDRMVLLCGKAQANVDGYIEWLNEHIKALERAIEAQIQACQQWRQTQKYRIAI